MNQSRKRHARRKLKKQVDDYFNQFSSNDDPDNIIDDVGSSATVVESADAVEIPVVVEPFGIADEDFNYLAGGESISDSNDIEMGDQEDTDTSFDTDIILSSSESSESLECVNKLLSFNKRLSSWASKYNLGRVAVNDLLTFLKGNGGQKKRSIFFKNLIEELKTKIKMYHHTF